jgi:hypothetical protein
MHVTHQTCLLNIQVLVCMSDSFFTCIEDWPNIWKYQISFKIIKQIRIQHNDTNIYIDKMWLIYKG